jgi:hypothetical protein
MNRQDMMYRPEIYDRPMFQTPQTRQGGGIMAGVAPVQGFEDGGEASFMDYIQAGKDMIVGDDGTMSDFFTMDKTAEGSGLNARDLTDFFIVDPEDPTDVAIATATAGLLAGGITAPAALVAKLAQMGYKGKKVMDAVSKAVEVGQSGTLKGLEGTRQLARMAPGTGELIAEEGLPRLAGGIADLISPQAMAAQPGEEVVEEESSFTDYLPDMGTVLGAGAAGIAGLVGLKSPKAREALGKAAGAAARNPIKTTAGALGTAAFGPGLVSPFTGGDDPEPQAPTPQTSLIAEANVEGTSTDTSDNTDSVEEPGFFSKAGNVLGNILSDKKLRAGLIRASKPTEGFVPRSFAADVYEGGRDYELEQANIDRLKANDQTQFEANFEFLKEKFPEKSNEEIQEIALSLNSKSKNATAIATLFKALSDDPANAGKPATELWNQATIMVTGNAGAGGTPTVDKDGNVINLTEEEAAAAS